MNGSGNQQGYGGYPPRGPAPGTPSSTHATTPMSVDSGSAVTPKRKSLPSGPPPPSATAPPPHLKLHLQQVLWCHLLVLNPKWACQVLVH